MEIKHTLKKKNLGKIVKVFLVLGATFFAMGMPHAALADNTGAFVRVSPRDQRYFELSDGSAYIPIGLNMIHPQWDADKKEGLAQMERWIKNLSENRGNFLRIWLSHHFWDIEHSSSGQYDGRKAERIDALVAMARKYNVRLKLTLEHFRNLEQKRGFGKSIHHISQGGPAESITDFFTGPRSRDQFKKKLDWYAERYGSDPVIFAWELWNEINCVAGSGWDDWTEQMLAELHRRFPKNLATQSLGSFDHNRIRRQYLQVCSMPGNDISQVHRYLDLGASLEVCRGPVDVLAAEAVRELRAFDLGKPILLAEAGAVEPRHSGPFKLYEKDRAGIILHDVLFAPFFSGAAGPGQIWHWDRYVARNNLWYHFGRFAEAVKNTDPPAENFEPIQLQHPQLRVYALKGRRIILIWCRDADNTWRSELQDEKNPQTIRDAALDIGRAGWKLDKTKVRVYDPWQDSWTATKVKADKIALPDFSRSVVVRIESDV
jgi:hypothetical protein